MVRISNKSILYLRVKTSIFISILLVGLFFSCTKFDHLAANNPIKCDLCDFADSIEGTFVGLSNGVVHPNGNTPYGSDTFYIELKHIFLNTASTIDSTVMFFRTKAYQDSSIYYKYDTICINNRNGMVLDAKFENYVLNPDSIYIFEDWNTKYGYVIAYDFTGYK